MVLEVEMQEGSEWEWCQPDPPPMDHQPSLDDLLNAIIAEEERKKREAEEADLNAQLLAGLNMPRSFIPRPYQVEGAIHFRKVKRGMIYDQPGLGKTLQGAMALTTPCIISCPGYLVDQWCDFLEDQYPQWKVARIHGLLDRYRRQALLDEPHDVYVINHEMWAGRREPWKGAKEPKASDPDYSYQKWYKWKQEREAHRMNAKMVTFKWPKVRTLILDESHHFRNKDASMSKNMANFSMGVDQVLLLTATPQYKDVRDWWHQLHIMDPAGIPAYWNFLNKYTYTTGWNESIIKVKSGMDKPLRDLIAKYAVGRTYDEVGLFLPDIIEKVVKVNWHPDLKKAYREIKNNLRIQTQDGNSLTIDPGSVLHTLRMMTANPEKVQAVRDLIEDLPGDEPIIIFAWYRDTAEMLAEQFSNAPSSVVAHGGFTQAERLKRATDITTRVKCVTMASMSEGVDWSEANTVVFFEEDYTPGKIYQALSRVRRYIKDPERAAKKQPIVVYYVHVKESVDEAVHEAVTERQGDVRRILRRALK